MTELHVGDGGWLRYDPAWTYRFGVDPDAPDLLVLGVDDDGVEWWIDEPPGWAAPTPATPVDERPYGDGGYDGDTTFGPRPITVGGGQEPGLAAAPDAATARRAWARLRRIALSRDRVLFTGPDMDDDGNVGDWSLWLRTAGDPKLRWVDERTFEWSLVLVAPDPFKFDARELAHPVEADLPVPPSGAHWSLTWPVAWGVGGTDTAVQVVNRGDEPAQVTYAISNPPPAAGEVVPVGAGDTIDRPTVVNDTTGVWFTIDRILGPGDVVEVDTRNATVRLNGVSIFLDLAGSFPLVEVGANTIRWSHEGRHNPRARLTVTTASTRK